jgi:dihydroflavonol-4-reductase
VDVRDVADGIIAAVDKGRSGECYILSNTYTDVATLLDNLHH